VWHYPFLLSNDGNVVVTLRWENVLEKHLADGTCIEFWNRDGVFKAYTFAELCPDPARTWICGSGQIGFFVRTWYTQLDQDADTFHVRTTDLYEYTFSLADSQILSTRIVWVNLLYKPSFYVALLLLAVVVRRIVRYRRQHRAAAASRDAVPNS
jgi:hypothetical protein